jgi:hypothetical protein
MSSLSARNQLLIGLVLALTMIATRLQHACGVGHILDASWAIFFLGGFYLRSSWAFAALMAEAVLVDLAAITWGGVSSFCISPAYALLLPAHAALWLAGRWYAAKYRATWSTLPTLAGSVFVGTALAELIASGGFYAFSGRFSEITLAGFGGRLAEYFPTSLEGAVIYVGLAAIAHTAVLSLRGTPALRVT